MTLSCAAWNLRVGRNAGKVAHEVDQLLTRHKIDVLMVCEAAGYVGVIRRHLKGRYVVSTGVGISGRDSAIISRKGLKLGRRRVHRLERRGWERKPGRPGLHHPRSMVSRDIAGIRFASPHMPPAAAPNQSLRRLAMLTSLQKVMTLGARWSRKGRRWVMAGDWNTTPDSNEAKTLARHTGAKITGTRIDWVLSRTAQVSGYQRITHGNSDHRPILFTVR